MPQCEKEVSIKAGNSTAFPQCRFLDHSHAGIRAKFCYLSLNCPFKALPFRQLKTVKLQLGRKEWLTVTGCAGSL